MTRTLLDAYALIALLARERAEPAVRGLIASGDCVMQAVNLIEVLDHLRRVRAVPGDRIDTALDPLFDGPIEVMPLDLPVARRAAEIRARHYDRTACPISLADSALLASAAPGDSLATADAHVLAVAEAEEVRPIELPLRSA